MNNITSSSYINVRITEDALDDHKNIRFKKMKFYLFFRTKFLSIHRSCHQKKTNHQTFLE